MSLGERDRLEDDLKREICKRVTSIHSIRLEFDRGDPSFDRGVIIGVILKSYSELERIESIEFVFHIYR